MQEIERNARNGLKTTKNHDEPERAKKSIVSHSVASLFPAKITLSPVAQ
jgi:hypothetical protein